MTFRGIRENVPGRTSRDIENRSIRRPVETDECIQQPAVDERMGIRRFPGAVVESKHAIISLAGHVEQSVDGTDIETDWQAEPGGGGNEIIDELAGFPVVTFDFILDSRRMERRNSLVIPSPRFAARVEPPTKLVNEWQAC